MIFQNNIYIYLALVVSILLFLLLKVGFKLKMKLINNFGDINIIKKFSQNIDFTRTRKKTIMIIIVIFFLFITLARPQWGSKISKINRKGLNIMVMLDVSKSMLAEDIKPSRLEKAKHQVDRLADYLQGDRIGLLVFAGSSFLQCPLTIDYSAFRMYLDNVNVNSVNVQGTALSDALKRAVKSFPEVEKKYKVIILLTDGEDHQGQVLEIAEEAKKEGIIIYTIGIGTPNGDLIPLRSANGTISEYKKDKSGNPVLSRLDEVTLEKIALITGGKYYQATETEFELKKVYEEIMKMEKKMIFGKQFSQREDKFQWFLFPAVLLLLFEILMKERKK
ncbi:MAG: VWA domain-containing protein [Spirochaetes bacterium]|nr:VWA domain-containing protein [Spirochaetota bacterium]